MINVPATNPYFLISPKIKDATLTIDLNVTIQTCFPTCIYIPTIMSGSPISMTSLLQVSYSVTLSHYLFR